MLAVGTAPSKCVAILARFTSAHQGLCKPPRIAFESVFPIFVDRPYAVCVDRSNPIGTKNQMIRLGECSDHSRITLRQAIRSLRCKAGAEDKILVKEISERLDVP